jgi:hypothetical protein
VVDWFVLLTPFLVLSVIFLLGFTGCDLAFPLDPVQNPLTLEIRLPSQLTVNEAQFRFTQPGSNTLETTTSLDRTDDGSGTAVLSHLIPQPATGDWAVTCRIQVVDGSGQASDTTIGTFTIDQAEPASDAIFETSGSPATGDFKVLFTGLVAAE